MWSWNLQDIGNRFPLLYIESTMVQNMQCVWVSAALVSAQTVMSCCRISLGVSSPVRDAEVNYLPTGHLDELSTKLQPVSDVFISNIELWILLSDRQVSCTMVGGSAVSVVKELHNFPCQHLWGKLPLLNSWLLCIYVSYPPVPTKNVGTWCNKERLRRSYVVCCKSMR